VVKGKATILPNSIYLPFELIDHAEQQEQEKLDKAKAKRKAKEDKEAAKAAKRTAQTCFVGTCSTYTRIEGGAKGWFKCQNCNALFCKQHKEEFKIHTANCAPEATSGLMTM